jgi:hypothetical protein
VAPTLRLAHRSTDPPRAAGRRTRRASPRPPGPQDCRGGARQPRRVTAEAPAGTASDSAAAHTSGTVASRLTSPPSLRTCPAGTQASSNLSNKPPDSIEARCWTWCADDPEPTRRQASLRQLSLRTDRHRRRQELGAASTRPSRRLTGWSLALGIVAAGRPSRRSAACHRFSRGTARPAWVGTPPEPEPLGMCPGIEIDAGLPLTASSYGRWGKVRRRHRGTTPGVRK